MKGYNVERWTGKAWNKSLCSPYKTMSEVQKHLEQYSWHYTKEYPYRITDYIPDKIKKYSAPKFNSKNWNSDRGMITKWEL
jgi:uncharacterized membrane-anchored protein YjiN (DUF445 family)